MRVIIFKLGVCGINFNKNISLYDIYKNKCVHILGTCEVVTTCGEELVDFSEVTQPRALDKGEGSGVSKGHRHQNKKKQAQLHDTTVMGNYPMVHESLVPAFVVGRSISLLLTN